MMYVGAWNGVSQQELGSVAEMSLDLRLRSLRPRCRNPSRISIAKYTHLEPGRKIDLVGLLHCVKDNTRVDRPKRYHLVVRKSLDCAR